MWSGLSRTSTKAPYGCAKASGVRTNGIFNRYDSKTDIES
jgi:hypothetical protein